MEAPVETKIRTKLTNRGDWFVDLRVKSLKTQEHKMRMVADAAVIEPVSAINFPANREINRENRKIGPEAATRSPLNAVSIRVLSDIPLDN